MSFARGLFVSILLGCAAAVPAQTTQPLTAEQERQIILRQIEAEAAGLPVARAKASELVQLSIQNNMLIAGTTLAPNPRETRLIVPELSGVIRMRWFGARLADNAASIRAGEQDFQLIQQDLTNATLGHAVTMVSAVAGRVLITRDSEDDLSVTSVQLVQDPPPVPGIIPDQDFIRLLVSKTGVTGHPGDVSIRLSATTFMELRLNYRRELDAYLRPIVRPLGQEKSVFAVPSNIAWQVLAADFSADETVQAKVRSIIQRLEADDYRQRQAALAELKSLGQPAVIVLLKMDRSRLSVQQSAEIEAFLAAGAPLAASDSRELVQDPNFLMDILYSNDVALRSAAAKRLAALMGKTIELDPQLDADARTEMILKLREQLAPSTQPSAPR